MNKKVFFFFVVLFSFLFLLLQSQTYRIKVVPKGKKKYGYVDLQGNLVIKAVYKNARDFSEEGTALVFDGQKKFNPGNLINARLLGVSGEVIADISDFNVYDDPITGRLTLYNSGVLVVLKSRKKRGALNSTGKIVVPLIYDWLSDFDNGYALGRRDKNYYIVKTTGEEKMIEGLKITFAKRFSEGLAPVEIKGQNFGFIDTLGNMVIKPEFLTVDYFLAGYAWVRASNSLIGFIDKNGEWIAQPQFDNVKSFDKESGLAVVRKDGKTGYLDTQGNIYYFEATERTYVFSEGLAIGRKNNLVGFINNKGEFVIEPIYKVAYNFNNGYARVEMDGKWGLIDKKGNWVIEPIFKEMGEVILINP